MRSLAEKRDEKQASFATEIAWSDQHREGCTHYSQEKKAELREWQ